MPEAARSVRLAVVVKGYPRLSETFIAQEILGLERRGLQIEIWSLRHPTEQAVHPLNQHIQAPVRYLPEYLHREPTRVLRGLLAGLRRPGFGAFARAAWRDVGRDPSASRLRRIGQALVMARELPREIGHLHVHYLHTPASVVRYVSTLTGRSWSFSAHAKDIWTTAEWDKREKLADADWGVTCTREGANHLQALAPTSEHVRLVYHGLDLGRFPAPPTMRLPRDGCDPADPLRILAVGRAVEKKGFGDALRALAALPDDLHWTFVHVGGGELLAALKLSAKRFGIADRTSWLGPKTQPDIISLLREADLFILPARGAASGDQDGLPNVLLEAASQELAILSTNFAGVPEFIRDGIEGDLVPPGDWEALSNALNRLARDPDRRARLGRAARIRLVDDFQADAGIDWLASRFGERTQIWRQSSRRPASAG